MSKRGGDACGAVADCETPCAAEGDALRALPVRERRQPAAVGATFRAPGLEVRHGDIEEGRCVAHQRPFERADGKRTRLQLEASLQRRRRGDLAQVVAVLAVVGAIEVREPEILREGAAEAAGEDAVDEDGFRHEAPCLAEQCLVARGIEMPGHPDRRRKASERSGVAQAGGERALVGKHVQLHAFQRACAQGGSDGSETGFSRRSRILRPRDEENVGAPIEHGQQAPAHVDGPAMPSRKGRLLCDQQNPLHRLLVSPG